MSVINSLSFKRCAIVVFCLALSVSIVFAQKKLKFSVADFALDPFDTSPIMYEKLDGDGYRYAIIKVSSNNPDDNINEYNFNFGYMKHYVEAHDGVLWVYVQRNAKQVTITRDGYAPIDRYDLHTTIESGKCYVMSLTSEDKRVLTQMVQFNVNPANSKAIVMIKSFKEGANEEIFGNVDATGSVAKNLEYGTYSYKVLADNYHLSDGQFTLNDRSKTHIENIELRSNYSDITFDVNADAEIYINGERKGTRRWSGVLKAGNYQVECRQPNHRSTSQYITVTENDNRTITLSAPEPILGTVAITSSPLGADIVIDGKNYGQTPQNIDIIIGKHNISVSKLNYQTENQDFVVEENRTVNVDITLGRTTMTTIKSKPISASLYIDGKYKGATPYFYEGETGTRTVKLFSKGYKPIEKKVYFGNDTAMVFSLQKQYVRKTDYYFAAGVGIGSAMNVSASLGTHINNFNIEVNYQYCFDERPSIYWYNLENSYSHDEARYNPLIIIGGKVGYGINAGTRFKFTPQIGYQFTKLKENLIVMHNSSIGYGFIDGAYCSSLTVGIRAYCAFSSHFGMSLTPEYRIGVAKSEGFKTLSDVSSKIKSFGEGFNLNLSLVVTL